MVVPKSIRDRLGLEQGAELDVVETANGFIVRKQEKSARLSVEEAGKRLRMVVDYQGPPLSIEQLSWHSLPEEQLRKE